MSHRFRFLASKGAGDWCLGAEEALHLSKVLRLGVGAEVEVFDGRGRWAAGVVTRCTASEVRVQAVSEHSEDPPTPWLELGIGALKPGHLDELLPMLCELGIDRLHVFGQVGVARSRLGPKVLGRWQRIALAASKQCKRPWLPEIAEHDSVGAWLAALGAAADVGLEQRLLLRGAGDPPLGRQLATSAASRLVVAVGGEKGFDPDEEAALLAQGFAPAGFGRLVLRAVTAAVAAAATMSLHRDQL